MKHLRYLKYVIIHKWYCLRACIRLSSPWMREIVLLGLLHDWSKFRPSEWFSYVEHFYGDGRSLDVAWLHHIHRNKHHHQYWVLKQDDGEVKCLDMPDKYILEMVADWYAAGMAICKRSTITPWYNENKHRIVLSERTRQILENVIKNFDKRVIK